MSFQAIRELLQSAQALGLLVPEVYLTPERMVIFLLQLGSSLKVANEAIANPNFKYPFEGTIIKVIRPEEVVK